ncbi:efflux RND transporter permease subunit [Marinilactibacillus kalidii]|uniref:efflux RND transporter permease subunit n=1 Tax=Marinilactibacillus kalidii TaxID=2820274 RepID=UPI001ABE149E|nr:efflux RND transporter permease subunit [Marinilactibacillus kalidii]
MKEALFRGIVKYKKIIITVFSILGLISIFLARFVGINNDMVDYLPSSSPSTQAIHVMEDEFPPQPSEIRVLLPPSDITGVLDVKDELAQVSEVTGVEWLDDEEDLEKPLPLMDQETLDKYYQDDQALLYISTEITEPEKRDEMIESIEAIVGTDAQMDGPLIQDYELDQHTTKDLYTTISLAVVVAFFVLLFTTSSWIEPLLILGTIGLAILINSGSNIFLGEISFVTKNAFPILQLGVSIDYSIFLLHRYEEYRKEGLVQEEAMVKALKNSLGSVLSSGLTTVIGFAALILMKFGIGADMGIVLAKGVILSLLSVFIFLPAMTLVCADILEKTMHKSFIPSLNPLAQFVYKVRYIVVPLMAVAAIVFFFAQRQNDFYYGNSRWLPEDNTVMQDKQTIEETFGHKNQMAIMIPNDSEEKEKEMIQSLEGLADVSEVQAYSNEVGWAIPIQYVPEDTREMLHSEDYTRMALETSLPAESPETFELIDTIRDKAGDLFGDDYLLAGDSVSTYDLKDVISADQKIVNITSIIGILIVIMIAFKSLILPALLVISIQAAIWINLGLPYFRGSALFYIAFLILSSVQLGATVDYAVLLTDRYLEERHLQPKKEALLASIEKSGESILVSGTIMTAAGFLFGLFSTNQVPAQIGYLLAQGTILSMIIVFFGLPILLYMTDPLIEKLTLKTTFIHKKGHHSS